MALPLAAVVGSLFGGAAWVLVAGALLLSATVRAWRVALCTALCAAVSFLHVRLAEQRGAELRALPQSDTPVLTGTVVRVWENALLLQPEGVSPSVYVQGKTEARLGDLLRVRVAEAAPEEPPPVRGMFDRAAWLKGLGCGAVLTSAGAEKLGRPWSFAAVRGMGLQVRNRLAARLMPPGREKDARRQVLCAMLLGAKDLAEADTLDIFRRGGCLHVFAVSGMHVGVIMGFFWGVFRFLRVRPQVSRLLVPVVVGVYILLTGCAVSALRAYLMGAALWGGIVLRRRISLFNTWCAAACLILLVCPYECYDAGFLLSFAVYAAIGVGLRLCLKHDAPWFGPDAYIPFRVMTARELWVKKTEQYIRGVVVVSLSAWLAALPVTWYCFHTVNPWGFLCNMAIALPVPLMMFCGIGLAAFSGIPYVGSVAAWAADASGGLLVSVAGFFASLPGAYLPTVLPPGQDAVAVYDTGYGKSCVVLGNPGVVIGAGSPSQVRYTVAPALFHAGFTPAVVLAEPGKRGEGARRLAQQWRGTVTADSGKALRLTTKAGRYTLYPPPPGTPASPPENALPVILWEHGSTRTLYVGDASAAAAAAIPPEERRADVIILGAHPVLPWEDAEDIAAFGAAEIQLLPSARRRRARLEAEQGNNAAETGNPL